MVSEYLYAAELATILNGKVPLSSLINWGPALGFVPSSDALVFVDSHDTQRGLPLALGQNRVLTHKQRIKYIMANVFMLAHPYGGIKRIMSSYYFHDEDQGPPSDDSEGEGISSPQFNEQNQCTKSSGWVCEHRWPPLVAMVQMANYFAVSGQQEESIVYFQTNGQNQVAFCRGYQAFIAINNDVDNEFNMEVFACLEPGLYCDVVTGGKKSGKEECHGKQLLINEQGYAKLQLPVADGNRLVGVDAENEIGETEVGQEEQEEEAGIVESYGILVIYKESKIETKEENDGETEVSQKSNDDDKESIDDQGEAAEEELDGAAEEGGATEVEVAEGEAAESEAAEAQAAEAEAAPADVADAETEEADGANAETIEVDNADAEAADANGADAESVESDGADAETAETDGADAEVAEADGAGTKAADADGADAEAVEADGAEAEAAETDGSDAEVAEADGAEVDGANAKAADADGAEAEAAEAEVAEAEVVESDGAEVEAAEDGSVEADSEGAEDDSADAEAAEVAGANAEAAEADGGDAETDVADNVEGDGASAKNSPETDAAEDAEKGSEIEAEPHEVADLVSEVSVEENVQTDREDPDEITENVEKGTDNNQSRNLEEHNTEEQVERPSADIVKGSEGEKHKDVVAASILSSSKGNGNNG